MNPSVVKAPRDSNGELLRILAMQMIVMHHWVVHAMYPDVLTLDIAGKPWDHGLMLGLHGFCLIGVNCFVLLSGWYGIRLKVRGVINLWSICFFYALASLGMTTAYRLGVGLPCSFSLEMMLPVLLPFSHTSCWFIPCYVALMLLSPLLNAGIANLNRRQYRWVVVWLSVMNLWFGYFWQERHINPSGHTVLHFIWLYVIGGFLRRCCTPEWCRRHRWHCLWLYAGSALLWGILSSLKAYRSLGFFDPLWHSFPYCNPLVMGGAMGFFLFVMSFQFKCKVINWMATSVLAAYLLQDTIYPYHRIQVWTGAWLPQAKILALPLLSAGWLVAVVWLDQIRLGLSKPFWRWYEHRFERELSLESN